MASNPSPASRKSGGHRVAAGKATLASAGLYDSPEYLIRRAHQISTAAFADACRDLDLTPSQYAALYSLRQHGALSQNELGRLVALDRSTTAVVMRSLRDRRLVTAESDPGDRRKTMLSLTDLGRLLLGKAERLSSRSSEALLATLGTQRAKLLMELLRELADADPRRSDG